MSARGAEGSIFMGFRADAERSFALRDGVLAPRSAGARDGDDFIGSDDPKLPSLRVGNSYAAFGGKLASPGGSSSSSSSDAFLSMSSTPSGLLNPYGVWSPPRVPSEASSSEMDFGTARGYDTANLFFGENWLCDDRLFSGKPDSDKSDVVCEDYKFIVAPDVGSRQTEMLEHGDGSDRRHARSNGSADSEGRADVRTCSSTPCSCCYRERKNDQKFVRDSSSAVYGRYQIMDDLTEVLDECSAEVFRFSWNPDDNVVLKGNLFMDCKRSEDEGFNLSSVDKELQMLNSYLVEKADGIDSSFLAFNKILQQSQRATSDHDALEHDFRGINIVTNGEIIDDMEFLKNSYSIHPFPEIGDPEDVYAVEDSGPADTDARNCDTHKVEEDQKTIIDHALSNFDQEYEVFELRIFHRKNRTGFEENKDFPIVISSVIAGRYRVTEYLGSAAFSNVARAHDLCTGMDVCLKIIKNDKDFFDQSMDEIKLLKLVNKYDPADEHHILRLYDFFYYQEHLFIVTEVLRANLYEFQKYNQESGDEVYFTLPRIQAIARQCLEALVYLHHLNIVHCDLKPENILMKSYSRCEIKVIDLGSSCFLSDKLSLYVQSRSYRAPEVILGVPYDQKIDIWSLGCILAELYTGEVLFPNESVPMILARIIGTIGPIDMGMLAVGEETQKYFTEGYDLFHKNEEMDQLEYLIPEKTSLRRHLRCPDSKFVDFLTCLLQINPRKRPTASEALRHRWLSHSYR